MPLCCVCSDSLLAGVVGVCVCVALMWPLFSFGTPFVCLLLTCSVLLHMAVVRPHAVLTSFSRFACVTHLSPYPTSSPRLYAAASRHDRSMCANAWCVSLGAPRSEMLSGLCFCSAVLLCCLPACNAIYITHRPLRLAHVSLSAHKTVQDISDRLSRVSVSGQSSGL